MYKRQDLDDATKAQLKYGSTLTELLKQPLGRPLKLHEQVITLCVATHHLMMDVEDAKVKEFQMDMLAYFDQEHPEIGQAIEEKKVPVSYTHLVWLRLSRRPEGDMSLFRKTGIALFLLGLAYLYYAVLDIVRGNGKPSAVWLIFFTFTLTLGEMFFAPLGHAFIRCV